MNEWLKHYDIKTNEGIGLGDLLATFYNIFSLPIKKVELIEKSISTENPTKIISISNSEFISKIIQRICKRRNITHQTLENSVLADTLDFVTEYLSLAGLADFRKVFLDKMRISKFLKDARRPISSTLVINLFSDLYPFINRIKLNRLIPTLFDASMPKYYLLKSTHIANSEKMCPKKKRRILVLFTFENSVTVLAPVVKELLKKYDVRCVIAHPDSIKKCVELNLSFKTLGEYSSKKIVSDIRSQVLRARSTWKKISTNKNFPHIFSYKGHTLYEKVKPSLFLFYNGLFVYAIAFVKLFENVLQKENPSIVIVPDDTGLAGKAIVKLAKTKDIPTLTVQHSTIDDVLHYKDVQSDIMAVWGKISRNLLINSFIILLMVEVFLKFMTKEMLRILGFMSSINLREKSFSHV